MDDEIVQMFKEKNRAILITNLKFDIEKNIDVLLETVTNIFNLEFEIAIKNITSILLDSALEQRERQIIQYLNQMKLESYQNLEKAILKKKQLLAEAIDQLSFEEESMKEYYQLVSSTTSEISALLDRFEQLPELAALIEKMENLTRLSDAEEEDNLAKQRVREYLNNRLYGKLEEKLFSAISVRDSNLINKAKESYLKYQEISLKTT